MTVSSLKKFITNQQEADIVDAVENTSLVARLEDMNSVKELVLNWIGQLGLPITEAIVADASEAICVKYSFLTLGELQLAAVLAISGQLDDVPFHGSFSMYMNKVIKSYMHYRKVILSDATRRKEIFENSLLIPSPEEQADLYREIFKEFYRQSKEDDFIRDSLNICYNFLRGIKLMKVSKEEVDEALEYANKTLPNGSTEKDVKMLSRNYIVNKFFKKTDIDVVLKNIVPEYFN